VGRTGWRRGRDRDSRWLALDSWMRCSCSRSCSLRVGARRSLEGRAELPHFVLLREAWSSAGKAQGKCAGLINLLLGPAVDCGMQMAEAGGQALAAACRSRSSRLARSASISAEELSRSARSASSRSARSASCSSVWIPRRRARAHRTAIGATASEGAGWLEPRAYAAPSAMTARHRVSAAESAARG